ncbi:MAG: glutaminyl-peptide cyclotransferase [Flavobacteriales bacterium]|nr:glutaminyl-peptide cyclotransferase [Flavobacteriales bacterium]
MNSKLFIVVYFFYAIIFQSCDRVESPFSDINISTKYHFGDSLNVSTGIDYSLEINGVKAKSNIIVDSSVYRIGENTLKLSYKLDGEEKVIKRSIIVYPKYAPKELSYIIVKEYNHGTDIYTEGLEEYKGEIYESGGEYKKSKRIKYSIEKEKNRIEEKYTDDIFAEGITILNDTLYGLTYREYKIFKFDPISLKLLDVKKTPIDFEGWGLTNDGSDLIMSDGSNNIYYISPADYSIKKILQIYSNNGKLMYINELEYVDGLIYANVFMKDIIVVFEAESGSLLYKLNLHEIAVKHKKQGVLNGIAKLKNGNFLITGKHWDKLYEINISNNN